MLNTVLLIVVLVLVALALIVAEICTPTFGLLAVAAVGAVAWAVYLCFTLDGVLGIIMTIVALIGLPIYAAFAVQIIPKTALGRRLALKRELARQGEGTPEADELTPLVGRETDADSTLRPSGVIRIDGKRVVAQAESGFIEKGSQVRIVRAAGTHVVVREVDA